MNLFRVEEMWATLLTAFLESGPSTRSWRQTLGHGLSSQHLDLDLRGISNLMDYFGMLSSDEVSRLIFHEASDEGTQKVTPERLLEGRSR